MLLVALSNSIHSESGAAAALALILLGAALGLRSRRWAIRVLLGSLLIEEWFFIPLLAPVSRAPVAGVPIVVSGTGVAVALVLCTGVRLPDWAFAVRGKWLRRLLAGLVLAGVVPYTIISGLIAACLDVRNSWWLTQVLVTALFALLVRPAWDVLTRGWSGKAMPAAQPMPPHYYASGGGSGGTPPSLGPGRPDW